MPPVGFEPTIPTSARPQTYVGNNNNNNNNKKNNNKE
jgi:hypothetical protein